MKIKELVEKYFEQIKVEDADFIPAYDDTPSDQAYLLLNIPIAMLKEYLKIKSQNKKLPDGVEFWKETGLCERLRNCTKIEGWHEPLNHILDFLEAGVIIEYQELIYPPELIRLSITEIPIEFDKY